MHEMSVFSVLDEFCKHRSGLNDKVICIKSDSEVKK